MTIANFAGALGNYWQAKAKFANSPGHLLDGVIVLPGISGIRDQPAGRPVFDFFSEHVLGHSCTMSLSN